MLTAYQIDALQNWSTQLLDPVVEFLIQDIVEKISHAGHLTSTAAYEVWRAQNLGISQRKLKKELKNRLKISQNEVEQLLKQAAEVGYNFDISRLPTSHAIPFVANSGLQQIVDTAVKLAQDDLINMTQTIGFVGPDGVFRELTQAYQQACDYAFTKVFTGSQDYTSAVREATKNLAKKGIRTIDYESGVHTSLEAAVRRNIMGGMGLMQEQISQKNHDDLGCDGWEISAHAASAPDHEPIQGKQYSDAEYTRLNNSLVRRIGTLNCGHAASPIILGVNSPQYTPEELEKFRQDNETGVTFDGKHYTMYEATQRQRKFERTIRNQKRKILIDEILGDKEKLQNDQIKLVRLRSEYARFSKGVGLPMQHTRMEKAGFTWKHDKAAEKTANEYVSKEGTVANEASPRMTKKTNFAVNWAEIQSESYSACFNTLSENPNANEAVLVRARWALNNRDGKKTEEIYAIDMASAKEIGRIVDQQYESKIVRTKAFDRALQNAQQEGHRIMLIHNHPESSPPSYEDINAIYGTRNVEGLVVGHSGTVFRYTAPRKKIQDIDFYVAINRYKEYTYSTAFEKALFDLSEQYGFEFEVLRKG